MPYPIHDDFETWFYKCQDGLEERYIVKNPGIGNPEEWNQDTEDAFYDWAYEIYKNLGPDGDGEDD